MTTPKVRRTSGPSGESLFGTKGIQNKGIEN
jgi:hypothetical protein